jgi:hypothetical protein
MVSGTIFLLFTRKNEEIPQVNPVANGSYLLTFGC